MLDSGGVTAREPRALRDTRVRTALAATALIGLGALAALLTDVAIVDLGALGLLAIVFLLTHRWLLSWRILLAIALLVVLFIPIKRYGVPGGLPFDIEPYRLIVAFLFVGWALALLVDPRVRLRRTGLEWPIFLFAASAIASVVVNWDRVQAFGLDGTVVKQLTFFATFLLLVYLVASVTDSWATVDFFVKVLVVGGSIVAFFAVVEFHTGFNAFDHLAEAIPFLRYVPPADLFEESLGRSGRLRVLSSAQHPIALSAALVMLLPLAVYLCRRTGNARWWLAAGLLTMGALTSISRTGVVMLAVVVLVFLWLRRGPTLRLWPLLPVTIVVAYLALPNALGSLYSAFFPQGGLIAEQSNVVENNEAANNRLADLGPTLAEVADRPLLGQGFGTRVVTAADVPSDANALVLDNQWLALLAETGILGVAALVLFFGSSFVKLSSRARRDPSPEGWLYVAGASSVASFAVGMLTFDAFSFIQVTLLFFIVTGVTMAGVRLRPAPVPAPAAVASKEPTTVSRIRWRPSPAPAPHGGASE